MTKNQIYFAIQQDGKFLRIGLTANPEKKLRELQAENPLRVFFLGTIPGDRDAKAFLNYLWDEDRVRRGSEWFNVTPRLLEGVRKLVKHFRHGMFYYRFRDEWGGINYPRAEYERHLINSEGW